MRSIWSVIKKISPYIYGLSFVTFFMQLGATLVYGTGNNIVVGRLVSPGGLIFLRSFCESVSVLFKILSGYLSDKVQNRTIFLIIGYGSALIFKICFFITTLDLNLNFLFIVYAGAFILDRFANATRDAPKDAFITDQTATDSRFAGFAIRKGIGSMGTFVGGIIAFLFIKHKIFSASQIYSVAIFPVSIASIILWFMFVKKTNTSFGVYRERIIKTMLVIGFAGIFFVSLKFRFIEMAKSDFLTLLIAVFPLCLYQIVSKNIYSIIFSLLSSFLVLKFIVGTDILFGLCSTNIWYLLFKTCSVTAFVCALFWAIQSIFERFLSSSDNVFFRVVQFFSEIFSLGFVFLNNSSLLVKQFFVFGRFFDFLSVSNLNFLEKTTNFQTTIEMKNTIHIHFDNFIFRFILFYVTRKSGVVTHVFYLILFNLLKKYCIQFFLSPNIELFHFVCSFLSCLCLVGIYHLSLVLLKHIKHIFSLIIFSLINNGFAVFMAIFLCQTAFVGKFSNNTEFRNIIFLISTVIGRLITSRAIYRAIDGESFLFFVIKTIPLQVSMFVSFLFLSTHQTIFTIGFVLITEIFYNYFLIQLANHRFQDILIRTKFFIITPMAIWFAILFERFSIVSFRFINQFTFLIKYDIKQIWLLIFQIAIFGVFTTSLGGMLFRFFKNRIIQVLLLTFLMHSVIDWRYCFITLFISIISCNFTIIQDIFQKIINQMIENKFFSIVLFLPLINFNNQIIQLFAILACAGVLIWRFKPERAPIIHYLGISGLIFSGVLFKLYNWHVSLLLAVSCLMIYYNWSKIVRLFTSFNLVQIFLQEKSKLKTYWKIVGISCFISIGKLNDAFFFQRAVELGYKTECALIFAFMYLFFTISSILIHFFQQKESNRLSFFFLTISLALCNLFMSGYIPRVPGYLSFFLSIFFYGLYAGAFDIVISSAISKSTDNKKIMGTLFGFYYSLSGIFGSALSYVFYLILEHSNTGFCGLVATFPPLIALLFL